MEMNMSGLKRFFTTIWGYWKKFGEFMGNVVGRVFLMLFYFTVALPFGLISRLFSDPLNIKGKARDAAWFERDTADPSLDSAYNQF